MKRYKQPEIFARIRPRAGKAGETGTRREDVHGSGIYPTSGPWPKGKAVVRTPGDWNQRQTSDLAKTKKPDAKAKAAKIKAIVEKASEGVARKIKSNLDEAYHQGQIREKSGRRVGKQIRAT